MISHGLVGRLAIRIPQAATPFRARRNVEGFYTLLALRCAAYRAYATTTTRKTPVSRPKAGTGSKAATKRTTGAGSKSKTGTKKATSTKKATGSKRTGKKAAAKKPTAKRPKAKQLTDKQKERIAKRKSLTTFAELKQRALVEPKLKPSNPYQVVLLEESQKGSEALGRGKVGSLGKDVAAKYKNLSPAETEHYTHIANQNKAENEITYKKWVESHTPEQIRLANLARRHIRRLQLQEKKEPSNPHPVRGLMSAKTTKIKDDRLVKGTRNPFSLFIQDRLATGDYRHLKITEAFKLMGPEYKALPESEKKKYTDKAEQEKLRYSREYKSVYGHEPAKKVAQKQAS